MGFNLIIVVEGLAALSLILHLPENLRVAVVAVAGIVGVAIKLSAFDREETSVVLIAGSGSKDISGLLSSDALPTYQHKFSIAQ